MKRLELPANPVDALSPAEVSALIAMAWQDNTPFEAMYLQFGLSEAQVIALMRKNLKTHSFRVWRMRVRGRAAKHQSKRLSLQQSQRHSPLDTHNSAGAQAPETEADTAARPVTAAVSSASLR